MNLIVAGATVVGVLAGIYIEKTVSAISTSRARKASMVTDDDVRNRNRPQTMEKWKKYGAAFTDDRDAVAKAMIREIIRMEEAV